MATIEQLKIGLSRAHEAGDSNAARTFAKEINRIHSGLPPINNQGSVLNTLGEGATLGFADEIVGGINATVGTFDPELSDTTFSERYEGNRDGARADLDMMRRREPSLATGTELAGGLLSGGAAAGRTVVNKGGGKLINAARNVGAGGLLGGIYGAGSSGADTVGGVVKDTAIGTLLGAGTTTALTGAGLLGIIALKKAVKPETSTLHNKSIDVLEAAGIPLTTGQKTGSSRVKSVETDLSQSLFGPRLEKTLGDQRELLQGQLMKKAGFDASDVKEGLITETAIDNAKDIFSGRYSKALKNVTVKLDNDNFINSLAKVETKHQQFLPTQQKKEISKIIDELIDTAADSNGITGEAYQAMRSRLGKRQASLAANDPTMANFFKDMKRALDDGFLDSVDDITAQSKKNIDKEYARFKQLETVYKRGGGQQVESGVLPLPSLNRESKKNTGDKEWRGLLGAASRVLPDSTPNSGTAARQLNQLGGFGLASKAANAATFGIPYTIQQGLARGVGGNLSKPVTAATFGKLRKGSLLAVPAINGGLLERR